MPNVVLFAIREKVFQYILAPHGLDDELTGMSGGCFLHDGDGEREVQCCFNASNAPQVGKRLRLGSDSGLYSHDVRMREVEVDRW